MIFNTAQESSDSESEVSESDDKAEGKLIAQKVEEFIAKRRREDEAKIEELKEMVAKAKAEQKIEREKRMAYYANLRKQMAERDLTSEESSEASEAEESEAESESAIEKASKSSKTAPSSVVDDEPGQYVSANESSLEEITVESRPSKVIDDKTKTITKVIFNCF